VLIVVFIEPENVRTRELAAAGTYNHNVGDMYRGLFLNHATRLHSRPRLGVALDEIDALHNDPVLARKHLEHFAGFPLVIT